MLLKNLDKYDIILASGSPRRHALLAELGIDFTIEA
ncbi:MAG: septum formation inhibitor Maf, partial [Bacteroidetes bacterium]